MSDLFLSPVPANKISGKLKVVKPHTARIKFFNLLPKKRLFTRPDASIYPSRRGLSIGSHFAMGGKDHWPVLGRAAQKYRSTLIMDEACKLDNRSATHNSDQNHPTLHRELEPTLKRQGSIHLCRKYSRKGELDSRKQRRL